MLRHLLFTVSNANHESALEAMCRQHAHESVRVPIEMPST
jgi:hypothetical protein